MGVHDPLGRGQFGPQGLNWQDLCRGPLNIATYNIYISCGPHGFGEDFVLIFPIISLWELYMGMAAMHLDGQRTFIHIFNPPLTQGST